MKTCAVALASLLFAPLLSGQGFEHFVSVSGDRLMDGDAEYRFLSFNVPTLNYQEDEMAFAVTNPYALPTEFEMRDVFATVRDMGGRALRIYTIPVRNKSFPPESPTYVEGPGQFNEEAFKVTDMMLALANEYQVRVIFSFLNNHQWMGGRPNYAEFRGKTRDEFWTDRQLIEDFKQTIAFTVARKNTLTGVAYRDDKAILCWETGNELACPVEWTKEICRYLKSLDQNHLVMDGFFAIDTITVREESVLEPSIDIISSHHYQRHPLDVLADIRRNQQIIAGRKPYLIGEFGFLSTSGMQTVIDLIKADRGICGGLVWSLRHHRERGGFYWHSEPLGMGIYKAYHYPGFRSGDAYDETNLLATMREQAFAIQGRTPPPVAVPIAPVLLPIAEVYAISWKGSAGAAGYHVERAPAPGGPWEVIAYNVSDAETPYFPLFHDQTAKIGSTCFYRVIAANASGVSAPSNTVGPVSVRRQAIIDTAKNFGVLFESKNVVPVTGNDRSYKEVLHRLEGDYGSEVTYWQPGPLRRFSVYSFEGSRSPGYTIQGSTDGQTWQTLDVKPTAYVNAETNYAYLQPRRYTYEGGPDYRFLKVFFKGKAQIARVEIVFGS